MAGAALVIAVAWLGLATADSPVSAAEPAAAAAGAAVVATGSGRQGLVGQWVLNAAESDDPRAKLAEGRPEGGPPGPGGGPGFGGPRRGGGFGGRGPGAGGRGGSRGGGRGADGEGGPRPDSRPLVLGAERFTITNLEPEVTILEPDGATRRLHADGKTYKDSQGAEVKARWQKDALVVETKAGRRGSKETWSATSEPRRLTVVVELDRPFRSDTVTIRRVFDSPPPAAAPTEAVPAAPPDANP